MSEKIKVLTELVAKCEELECTVDDNLKRYFKRFTGEANLWLNEAKYHQAQDDRSPELLTAWNEYIAPISGLKGREVRWNDDHFWYEISVSDSIMDNVMLGRTFEDALSIITRRSPTLLSYT